MRSPVAGLAVLLALGSGLASACSSDQEAGAPDPPPVAVELTGEDRDAFLGLVTELGYTCGAAIDDTAPYVACTRPGTYPDALGDTVTLTSTRDGAQVQRVAYCGAEQAVIAAMSEAFLGEVGSPELLPDPAALEPVDARVCSSSAGQGSAGEGISLGGPPVPTLLDLDPAGLRPRLEAAGWSCVDSRELECREPGRGGTLVVSVDGAVSVQVSASDGEALGEAMALLGLSAPTIRAARDCRPDATCEHLLVDGFDLFFTADEQLSRLILQERVDF